MINEIHNELFTSPKYQKARDHFSSLETIPEDKYLELHKKPIQPLGLSIDLDLYNKQIEQAKDYFQPWGINKQKDNRYGLALTKPRFDTDDYPDPGNWPLDIWTYHHPDQPLIDCDLTEPTKWFDYFTCLQPLYDIFKDHICRTNVTLWNKGGQFYPHIDSKTDFASSYRLWISNKTGDQHHLLIGGRSNINNLVNFSNMLIPGELYLLDTSRVHHGIANEDFVSSMLMSVLPSATSIIEEMLNDQ
jgi:hypothetical protein